MRGRSIARIGAAVAALMLVVGTSVACSSADDHVIDYAVDGTLITYNTNTVVGAASGGPR